MAKYQQFEELPVWQEAARLYNAVQDLLEQPNLPLTAGLRNQLDRAALSVSSTIAQGFERAAGNDLLSFIASARSSAGEVRSMIAAIKDRPKLKAYATALQAIRSSADSCARQLGGWAASMRNSSAQGAPRVLTETKGQGNFAQRPRFPAKAPAPTQSRGPSA